VIELSAPSKEEAKKIFHLFITSGYNGDLRFFENRGAKKSV